MKDQFLDDLQDEITEQMDVYYKAESKLFFGLYHFIKTWFVKHSKPNNLISLEVGMNLPGEIDVMNYFSVDEKDQLYYQTSSDPNGERYYEWQYSFIIDLLMETYMTLISIDV